MMKSVEFSPEDIAWMQHALQLAKTAAQQDEVPVGAVLIADNQIVGEGWNRPIGTHDATAHAEIVALRAAAKKIENYRLVNTTMYVTLEPCLMCVGAMVHARVKRVVFGARDSKTGAVVSVFQLHDSTQFNHRIEYAGDLLSHECGQVLRNFFQQKR